MSCHDCWSILFAICFPPCGVFCRTGCSCDLVINVLLTILGFFPGVLHALYVIGAWSERESHRCPQPGQQHPYQHLQSGPPTAPSSSGVVPGYPVSDPHSAPPSPIGASRDAPPSAPPFPGKGADSKV